MVRLHCGGHFGQLSGQSGVMKNWAIASKPQNW
jgi:hypothetical protein